MNKCCPLVFYSKPKKQLICDYTRKCWDILKDFAYTAQLFDIKIICILWYIKKNSDL